MTNKHTVTRTRHFANAFGALGYMSLVLQWGWALLIYIPYFLDSQLGELFLPSTNTTPAAPAMSPPELSPLTAIIAAIITVAVLALTVVIALRAPVVVGKTGQKITTTAAKTVAPVITKHQPLPKKKQRLLTARLIALAKALLVITPLLGILPAQLLAELPLDATIILAIAGGTAVLSLIFFALQYAVARLLRTPTQALW